MAIRSSSNPECLSLLNFQRSYDPSTKIGIKFKTRWYVTKAIVHHTTVRARY